MRFNLFKSIRNDYLLQLLFSGIIIAFGFFLFACFGPDPYRVINIPAFINKVAANDGLYNYFLNDGYLGDIIVGIVLIVIFLVSLIFFLKRVAYIKSFNGESQSVNAMVKQVSYIRGTRSIDLEFPFNGQLCKKHFALMNNSKTKNINADSEVKLFVKNQDPKKSLIVEFYFDL